MIRATQILKKEIAKDPKDKNLANIELKIAKENFRINYYLSRVNAPDNSDTKIFKYVWNGSVKTCDEGTVSDTIVQKVEDRINYFRVSAGVPPIYLDSQLNNWCQKAALAMESNNKLNHDIPKIWKCFTDEGAEAAKYSLLAQNINTSLAVTSFVADQTHPSLGNRRWMLYPFSMAWGHGSTSSKCVLWALDDSRKKDTVFYANNFIAWPYNGYMHKMFVFKRWSFSLYEDLSDAKVSMKLNNIPLKLSVEKLVDGYGLPTLAWTPVIETQKLKEGDVFEVNITLKNKKVFKYEVRIFDTVF
ncbi:MAG: CAP domain-containing protein [Flavobacteriales bacterium]|nr:CAP domain-containing protein [Flavobacteriales bacterium]